MDLSHSALTLLFSLVLFNLKAAFFHVELTYFLLHFRFVELLLPVYPNHLFQPKNYPVKFLGRPLLCKYAFGSILSTLIVFLFNCSARAKKSRVELGIRSLSSHAIKNFNLV